jgi:PAS domain S-box-containing protein
VGQQLQGAAERDGPARQEPLAVRFREVIESLPCVVYVARPTWPPEIVFITGNVERHLGYTPEELYADSTLAFGCIHPDDRDRVLATMREAVARGEPYSADYRFVQRNGTDVRHVTLHSAPIAEAAGPRALRQGIVLDVTAEKRLERELLQSQRLAAIGEMAAMMAHEIRNPLAGMSLALRMLRSARGDTEIEDECLSDLAHCLERINATVSRVLDFSKARPLKLRRCRLADVLDGACRLTATYARKSDVAVEIDLAPGLPDLVADPDQLEQVFVSLILNACKATPDGGRVTLGARADAGRLHAEVADAGIGIPPEQLEHIFDPFYSGFGHGTGLGLTLCQRIVRAHGGTIGVDSRPGQGSTFRIDLPLEPTHVPRDGD